MKAFYFSGSSNSRSSSFSNVRIKKVAFCVRISALFVCNAKKQVEMIQYEKRVTFIWVLVFMIIIIEKNKKGTFIDQHGIIICILWQKKINKRSFNTKSWKGWEFRHKIKRCPLYMIPIKDSLQSNKIKYHQAICLHFYIQMQFDFHGSVFLYGVVENKGGEREWWVNDLDIKE